MITRMESPRNGVSSIEMINADAQPSTSDHSAVGVDCSKDVIIEVASGPSNEGEQSSRRVAKQGQAASKQSDAKRRIRTLMWLKEPGNEIVKEALEALEKQATELTNRMDSYIMQVNSVKNEIYQFTGFYTIFQGVILTAVAQSSLLVCHNWWTTFFLSLLASLVTLVGVTQKFLFIRSMITTIGMVRQSLQVLRTQIDELQSLEPEYSFEQIHTEDNFHYLKGGGLKIAIVVVVSTLFLFSGLFLASSYQILCDLDLSVLKAAHVSQP